MFTIALVVVLLSAVLVFVDADRLRRERGLVNGPNNQSPIEWAIATALLWIIVVPYYLMVRNRAVDPAAKPQRSAGRQLGRGCLFGLIAVVVIAGALLAAAYFAKAAGH